LGLVVLGAAVGDMKKMCEGEEGRQDTVEKNDLFL